MQSANERCGAQRCMMGALAAGLWGQRTRLPTTRKGSQLQAGKPLALKMGHIVALACTCGNSSCAPWAFRHRVPKPHRPSCAQQEPGRPAHIGTVTVSHLHCCPELAPWGAIPSHIYDHNINWPGVLSTTHKRFPQTTNLVGHAQSSLVCHGHKAIPATEANAPHHGGGGFVLSMRPHARPHHSRSLLAPYSHERS